MKFVDRIQSCNMLEKAILLKVNYGTNELDYNVHVLRKI